MPSTYIYVDLVDQEGYTKGRTIPVLVEYITDIDKSFGADADGAQGVLVASREILDVSIEHEHLLTMNSNDVEYCLDEARYIFSNRIR